MDWLSISSLLSCQVTREHCQGIAKLPPPSPKQALSKYGNRQSQLPFHGTTTVLLVNKCHAEIRGEATSAELRVRYARPRHGEYANHAHCSLYRVSESTQNRPITGVCWTTLHAFLSTAHPRAAPAGLSPSNGSPAPSRCETTSRTPYPPGFTTRAEEQIIVCMVSIMSGHPLFYHLDPSHVFHFLTFDSRSPTASSSRTPITLTFTTQTIILGLERRRLTGVGSHSPRQAAVLRKRVY